jgi:hypothetical protein
LDEAGLGAWWLVGGVESVPVNQPKSGKEVNPTAPCGSACPGAARGPRLGGHTGRVAAKPKACPGLRTAKGILPECRLRPSLMDDKEASDGYNEGMMARVSFESVTDRPPTVIPARAFSLPRHRHGAQRHNGPATGSRVTPQQFSPVGLSVILRWNKGCSTR